VIARLVPHHHHGSGSGVVWLVAIVALLLAPHLAPASSPGTAAPPGRRPAPAATSPAGADAAARAVAFALVQRGKPYRWGAAGPDAYDCSGLTWAAWRHAGVAIPRTAAGQLASLPRATEPLRPGDLLVYRSSGPSRRHVAMVVSSGRMVEARGAGSPVRVRAIRPSWLGAVRPAGGGR
jgi:cell wall-associated NlpC family hydrolase